MFSRPGSGHASGLTRTRVAGGHHGRSGKFSGCLSRVLRGMGSHPRFAERRHRRNACSHLAERNSNLLPAAHRINPFPAYLREQLEEKLKERRVVVWYDLNREFAPFVEALSETWTGMASSR